MSAPDLLPDGYRVTLECGHSRERTARPRPESTAVDYCEPCGRFQPVLDVTPIHAKPPGEHNPDAPWMHEPTWRTLLRYWWRRITRRGDDDGRE